MLNADDLDDIEIGNYFRSNLLACARAVDPADFKRFAALETNGERVEFVLSYPEAHELPLEIEGCPEKNLKQAVMLKELGNKHFGNGDFLRALETYSNAILIVPRKDMGVFLANRSAALYNLELYELALVDSAEALRVGYPQELLYKLEERRAKSYLALKNNLKAMDSFRSTLQALDLAKIPLEKKQKIESDVRMMLAVLEKGKQMSEKSKKQPIQRPAVPKPEVKNPPKITDINPAYPACSSAVEFRDAGGAIGRHAVATRDILPGELLIVEKPHSAVLLQEYQLRNCYSCFKKNVAAYPAACDTCAIIAYCSPKCRDADADIHKNECSILAVLWLSRASVTCLMAVKAILQTPWEQLIGLKASFIKAKRNFEPSKEDPMRSGDYRAYWSLVTHESERTAEDLFHRAYMAAWLLRVLKISSYLPEDVKSPDFAEHPLSEGEIFLADLLVHHIQLLQFNSHEVSEMVRPKGEKKLAKATNIFIGGALFSTLARLNHSCNPGVVRYYVGTTVVVRAIRTIRKGNEICENYGPIFTTMCESDRKRKLRLQYWFDCNCEACAGRWPLLEEINPKILRFRCETGPSCGNVLLVNTDSNEFMAHCSKCGKSTNVMKGLKALQDTDALTKVASRHLEDGENSKALKAYLEILKLLDETLALPIRDYHLCQQGVRLTLLPHGNIATH